MQASARDRVASGAAVGPRSRKLLFYGPSSWFDQVPAGHPGVLVAEHVTVVEPAARVVFRPAGGDDLVRAEGRVVHVRAGVVLPPVAVNVERVEHAVAPVD